MSVRQFFKDGKRAWALTHIDAVMGWDGKTLTQILRGIVSLFPSEATEQNQLADKNYVNSSVATASATYRGGYNLVSDLSLTTSAIEQQIVAAIEAKMESLDITPDNNDYVFVQIPVDDSTPTEIAKENKYKFNGTNWAYEYSHQDISGKADKDSDAVEGNVAVFDENGNPVDSSIPAGSVALLEDADSEEAIADFDAQADTLWKKAQVLTDAEKSQVKTNLGIPQDIYSKQEVNGMVTTPNQEYITVTATDQTTAATDVLPASGSADTVYRVGNWDGTQYDETVYSEYAWNGNAYVHLSVKSQVSEVFDISVYNNNATYADLAAALGTNGANVPASVRKGGMSVKFVHSSDNKYVRYNYLLEDATTNSKFVNAANWQGVDSVLTDDSKNLITSGAVKNAINILDSLILPFNAMDNITWSNGKIDINGTINTASNMMVYSSPIELKAGDMICLQTRASGADCGIIAIDNGDDTYTVVEQYKNASVKKFFYYIATSDVTIVVSVRRNDNDHYLQKLLKGTFSKDFVVDNINSINAQLLPIQEQLQGMEFVSAESVSYALDKLYNGSIQLNGSVSSTKKGLARRKFAISPCKISIVATSYTVNGTTYYPFYRVTAQYKNGTNAFLVGGFNNTDSPTCNDVVIDDTIDTIGFSVRYGVTVTGPFISEQGDDTLVNSYQNGDIQMTVEKTLSQRVNDIEDEISDINSTDILSLYPEKVFLPKVATLKKQTPYSFGTKEFNPLLLLIFTDMHGDVNNFTRIMQWKEKYQTYIDGILNLGDSVTDNYTDNYASVMPAYFEKGGDNVMLALGNHDCCVGGYYKGWIADPNYTIQDVYDHFTGLLDATSLGIVLPTSEEIGSVADYANFYYKDYTNNVLSGNTAKNIRLFVLDSCINVNSLPSGADATATQAYEAAQLSWFTAKLAEARTLGYEVVATCHCVPECQEMVSTSAFSIYPTSLHIATVKGASISMAFVDAVDDFIDDGGTFISWLVGHTHANHIGIITNHSNQLVVGYNTMTSRSYAASKTNPYRTGYNGAEPITETTDAFCMVEIDTYYKQIRMLNIGTDYDLYGRKKDMIVIDYANRQILGF